MYSFLLYGKSDCAVVMCDTDGNHIGVRFGHANKPAYNIALNPVGVLTIDFAGTSDKMPDLSAQLNLLADLPIVPNEMVPYGWVSNDRVVVVMYFSELVRVERNGVVVNMPGLSSYVLEGEIIPAELRMTPGDTSSTWQENVWEYIRTGRLVRLTDRFSSLLAWVESGGLGEAWLVFGGPVDDRLPVIVSEYCYVAWHPLEQGPGELFANYPLYATVYSVRVDDLFR